MQVIQERIKVPLDLVLEMRKISPGVPTEILVPYHEGECMFAPLEEMKWYPKLRCLAFAGGPGVDPIAFDVAAKCVVQLIILGGDDIRILPVNSSLESYARCVTHFIECMPYDNPDAEPGNIKAMMNAIDPGSADEETFWNEVAWDAGIGDWSTEILGLGQG